MQCELKRTQLSGKSPSGFFCARFIWPFFSALVFLLVGWPLWIANHLFSVSDLENLRIVAWLVGGAAAVLILFNWKSFAETYDVDLIMARLKREHERSQKQ